MFNIRQEQREAGSDQTWWARGLAALKNGDPFEAHEAWEYGWKQLPPSNARIFLQGLIQVAGSFVLLQKHRTDAAKRLLARGSEKLLAGGLVYHGQTYGDFTQLVESIKEYA